MKVYISARAKTQLANVKIIERKISAMGHKVISDWTSADVKRPYRDQKNRKHNIEIQRKMLKSAQKADVFIMLDEPGLRGAYVELGAFLTVCLANPEGRRAYIVGPHSQKREFIFESPEYIHFVDEIDKVYAELAELISL